MFPLEPNYTPARHFKRFGRTTVDFVVLHTDQIAEIRQNAQDVANAFARTDKEVSAHYIVDADTIVQCVREEDIAWHAAPNARSIGIEHAGFAEQTPEQWADDYSIAMLQRSAALVRRTCERWSIPMVRLSAADLVAGRRGICGHADVNEAWHEGNHTDPGISFPWQFFLGLVLTPPAPLVA